MFKQGMLSVTGKSIYCSYSGKENKKKKRTDYKTGSVWCISRIINKKNQVIIVRVSSFHYIPNTKEEFCLFCNFRRRFIALFLPFQRKPVVCLI